MHEKRENGLTSLTGILTDKKVYERSFKLTLEENQLKIDANKQWRSKLGLFEFEGPPVFIWKYLLIWIALPGLIECLKWISMFGLNLDAYKAAFNEINLNLIVLSLPCWLFILLARDSGSQPYRPLDEVELNNLKLNFAHAKEHNKRFLNQYKNLYSYALLLRSFRPEDLDRDQKEMLNTEIDRRLRLTQENTLLLRKCIKVLRNLDIDIVCPINPLGPELHQQNLVSVILPNNIWRSVVQNLIDDASIVIFVISDFPSDSLEWELEYAKVANSQTITLIEETYLGLPLGFERLTLPEPILEVTSSRVKSDIMDFGLGEGKREIVSSVTDAELTQFQNIVQSKFKRAES